MLPYNMTVYQAVKQFSSVVNDQSETEADTETPIGNYFRPSNIITNSNRLTFQAIRVCGHNNTLFTTDL